MPRVDSTRVLNVNRLVTDSIHYALRASRSYDEALETI